MSQNLPKIMAAAIVSAFTLQLSAALPSLNGTVNFGARSGIALDSSTFTSVTAVDFLSLPATPNAEVSLGASGDFSVLAGAPVIFKDFAIGTPLVGEWTVPSLPGWSFDLSNSSNLSTDNTFLTIAGIGVLHAPSFSDSLGNFTFTASRSDLSQIEFSFQASTSGAGQIPPSGEVPESGATVFLLASALLGVSAVNARKS